ncbi:MAG: hypothetical protein HN467_10290 [Opitutae bacterium]|nr:hypothetical protein [Opitutae bacterium]
MAGKTTVKKFLIGLCAFLIILASLGAWMGFSKQRKLVGDLRSSVFDGVGPSWLASYTFGPPEMLLSDLTIINFEVFYTENVKGKKFTYDESSGILSATDSDLQSQLKQGDTLGVLVEGKETKIKIDTIDSSSEVKLVDANPLKLDGKEIVSVRLYRPFTGTAYRFYGDPGKDGVDTVYKSTKAPKGFYFTHHGVLVEGEPPVDDHGGGHGGGHGGSHGESYAYTPLAMPGHFKEFYRNWPFFKIYRRVLYECHYKDGIKHGTEQYWQRHGPSIYKKTWGNGVLNGKFEEWYESGFKKLNAEYLDGKLNGEYMAFHKTGEKSLKTKFKAGKLDGRYETWNIHNKRQYNKKFVNGQEEIKKPGGSSAH